jgi:hypothetical protein
LKSFITFTGKVPQYLRMDGAKEFHSAEMLDFCRGNKIIIQPVIAYNHTAMCRVESYIGVVKSHALIGMLNAHVLLRFHGDTVQDFVIKRNFTWYSQKGLPSNTTAHQRMNPAFAGTLKSVCIPFGSRIISPLPREHTLVKGSSFGDRFVEGIYLFADSTSPAIHIWDMHRKQEMLVKDYTSYPTEFPFKDPSCLVRPGYTTAEILQMHQEDIAEEERIVAELAAPAVTRSQSAQLAATPLTVHPAPIIVVPSPLVSLPARSPVSVAQPLSTPVTTRVPYLDSLLDTPMTSINELDLGKALLKAGFPITLPASYANFPQIQKLPTASGPMVAIGYKTERLTAVKSALWVRFTSPPEFVGHNIQMYPKSFEPTKGPARGADFIILKSIHISHPHAVTLRDLGIHEFSSSKLTTLLLRHFSELSKPRESVPSAYDDHDLSDDNADETDSDSLFLPQQQSVEDNESIPLRINDRSGLGNEKRKEKSCMARRRLLSALLLTGYRLSKLNCLPMQLMTTSILLGSLPRLLTRCMFTGILLLPS